MIIKLNEIIPKSNCKESDIEHLYIIDNKHDNNGNVDLCEDEPAIKYFYLENPNKINIFFNGFLECALQNEIGNYSRQCECVLFSAPYTDGNWILFIETKYVTNIENAFRENNDYPNCMVDQIVKTVTFFRNKGIIDDRTVNAIVSFPTLIQDFGAYFFTGKLSIEDILIDHKIRIRATNSALVKSAKRIKF